MKRVPDVDMVRPRLGMAGIIQFSILGGSNNANTKMYGNFEGFPPQNSA